MIEHPHRSVTRFFVPLIDVMILLFCIFLLMPFVSTTSSVENSDASVDVKPAVEDLPTDVLTLRRDLEKARREADKLRAEKGNLSESMSVKVLEIDPRTGRLYYLQDGERVDVTDQAAAETVITLHKRHAKTKEPFFLILYPRQRSGYPEQQQADAYARWFRDVQFQFDRPFSASP